MALTTDKFVVPNGAVADGKQPMQSSAYGPTEIANMVTHINHESSTAIISMIAGLSINANNTKFDHGEITYIIVENDIPGAEVTTSYILPAATAIVDAHLTTANITYIGVDASGIIQSPVPFTPLQRRTIAVIGNLGHPGRTAITTAFNFPVYGKSTMSQLCDLAYAVGVVNTGNVYEAAGADLTIKKTSGVLTGVGVGYDNFLNSPWSRTVPAADPITSFLYVLRDGTNASATAIDPNFYDVAGVKTTVPANKFTIQIGAMFSGGFSNVMWGQELYDTLDAAMTHLFSASYTIPDVVAASAVLRFALIVKVGTTDLSDPALAYFKNLGKFGGGGLV